VPIEESSSQIDDAESEQHFAFRPILTSCS